MRSDANIGANNTTGSTADDIYITINNDAVSEGDEALNLKLDLPTSPLTLGGEVIPVGLALGKSSATLTIVDDDPAPTFISFSTNNFTVNEGAGTATITVLRSGGKAGGVTVDYTTAAGTATEGEDYTATAGTLTFEANETSQTFQIPLLTDDVPDGNKTVLLSLSNPGGGARLVAPTNAMLNIIDTSASVQFASATYSVGEAGRSVLLTVVRSGPPGTVAVTYSTANGTATSPGDYKAKTGVITFSGTATSRTVAIPILNDTTPEEAETFTVTLTNPTGGAQLGGRSTATVTIVDNDVAPRPRRR